MFLVTTPLKEFWNNEAEERVYLGSWCLFPDHMELWQKEREKILLSPWLDLEEYRESILYTESLSARLLAELRLIFNRQLRKRHSLKYWSILLGPWITVYVSRFLHRYTCLRQALHRWPQLNTCLLAGNPHPEKVRPFYRTDVEELRQYSQLLKGMGYSFEARELPSHWLQEHTEAVPQELPYLGRFVNRDARIVCGWLLYDRQKAEDILRRTGLSFDLVGYYDFEKVLPAFTPSPGHTIRLETAAIAAGNEMEKLLMPALASDLPAWLIEGYEYFDQVTRTNTSAAQSCYLSAIGCQESKIFQFLAATAVDKGSKLVLTQHGTMYGTYEYLPGRKLEEEMADTYLAWGWAPEEHPKLKNVSSPAAHPVSYAKDQVVERVNILYLSNQFDKYFSDFRSAIKCFGTDRYFGWMCSFLDEMPPELRHSIIFRSKGRVPEGISRHLGSRYEGLRFDTRDTPFAERVRSSRVAVCDCFTQVYNDALVNLPTVLYWDENLWRANAEARKYLDELKKVGVFWNSPAGAAAHLLKILPEPEAWWTRSDVQDAVAAFQHRFSRYNADFRDEWASTLRTLIDKSQHDENIHRL